MIAIAIFCNLIVLIRGFQQNRPIRLNPCHHQHPISSLHSCKNYNIQDATIQLPWETLEGASRRPVLNLSSRDQSFEESTVSHEEMCTSEWDQGQRWDQTRNGLEKRGLKISDKFLKACPQLLRLEPDMVLNTADWVLREFGATYLEAEPRLLGYRPEHVQYGLEFMSLMMMTDARAICRSSPAVLLTGIDGGIQEQAVKAALGAAGTATTKASHSIVGDAVVALQALKKRTQ